MAETSNNTNSERRRSQSTTASAHNDMEYIVLDDLSIRSPHEPPFASSRPQSSIRSISNASTSAFNAVSHYPAHEDDHAAENTSQEEPLAGQALSGTTVPANSAVRRLGRFALVALLCAPLFTAGAFAFIAFLWFSDFHNHTWHNCYHLRLGTLPGLPTQSVIQYDFDYPLDDTVDVYQNSSTNRTLPSGWYNYGVPQYTLQPREPTWMRSPPTYPAFAEYARPAAKREGIEDTGLLVRALLPFPDAQSRENIRNYTGKALVLDSRVSCQRPELSDLHFLYQMAGNMVRIVTSGTFAPSMFAERQWSPSRSIPFECSVFVIGEAMEDEAPPAVCQLQENSMDWLSDPDTYYWGNRGGGLVSEFSNLTNMTQLHEWATELHQETFITWGTAFLVFNATSYESQASGSTNYSMKDDETARLRNNGIWTEVLTNTGMANFSVSLCYAAWDTARADVNIFSEKNRSEPISLYQTDVSWQFGLGTTLEADYSVESRNILSLEGKDSWITHPDDALPFNLMPFVQNFGDASRSFSPQRLAAFHMQGNWTTVLHVATPGQEDTLRMSNGAVDYENPMTTMADDNIAILFKTFWLQSYSLARTLSSMITVLSSMAYYDQMPRFRNMAGTTQVFWVNVVYPQAHTGFVVIAVVLVIHNVIIGLAVFWFLTHAGSSLLGSHRQSVAQVGTTQTTELRFKGYDARDRDVDKFLKAAGREKEVFKMQRQMSPQSSVVDLVPHAAEPGQDSDARS
ncbi:hypothetical protein M409DRAFT_19547 [Zasmidium cellare ATCC 36951]|uniref:Uncharacterized protein n=1 Tax=Zasmidium cellare ATCC 36951 TaxID=1080233 RepID=A0A6A6CVV8_ZASCE|nr:uncharacterized protein M409DRAFT_19547 [Zasmidium cellare ATCC 36951]KAF2169929.1 hypothetical protein M409DRAFT_19547 [Zasmidium cellare ATCC 36951]